MSFLNSYEAVIVYPSVQENQKLKRVSLKEKKVICYLQFSDLLSSIVKVTKLLNAIT